MRPLTKSSSLGVGGSICFLNCRSVIFQKKKKHFFPFQRAAVVNLRLDYPNDLFISAVSGNTTHHEH